MRVTLTAANTAYPAPARAVGTSGAVQSFSYCAIVNGTAGVVTCGKSGGIIGGTAAEVGLPIAVGTAPVFIPTKSQLWFSSAGAGVIVDYEYF